MMNNAGAGVFRVKTAILDNRLDWDWPVFLARQENRGLARFGQFAKPATLEVH